MKDFLANMNLARWVILVSLVGSIGLGIWGWSLHGERVALEQSLVVDPNLGEVASRARNIQVLSLRHSELRKEYDREGLAGQDNPDTYFRRLAIHKDVALGGIEIKHQPEHSPEKGVVDRKYLISPDTAKNSGRGTVGFDRARIANFLWLLEDQSRRVRVTNIRLDPVERKDPWVPNSDRWTWEVEVTSRQKAPDS